jgi:lipoic acid synthetase
MSDTIIKPLESTRVPKPDWLKIKLPSGVEYSEVKKNVKEHRLHTICESGQCPNQTECYWVMFVRDHVCFVA